MAGRQVKQIWFFLTEDDEVAIAETLRERLPSVKLIDEWRWERVDVPPVRESPLDCDRVIGIWASDIAESVTGVARANGGIDGPAIAAIVQWQRCRRAGNTLRYGRWAASYEPSDKPVAAFVRSLWRIMESSTTNELTRTSGDLTNSNRAERRFRIGGQARELASRGEILLTADALTLIPEDSA
jgi:hypothetical protein